MSAVVSNGNQNLQCGSTIADFFDAYPGLKKFVHSFEETDTTNPAAHIITYLPPSIGTTPLNKPHCTYKLMPRNNFHWVFTGDAENTADVKNKIASRYHYDNCVERLTLEAMADDRDGYRGSEVPPGSTALKVAGILPYQKCRVREGAPGDLSGVYLNDNDILNVNLNYTIELDGTDTVVGFTAKDGPFAAASMGLFLTGIINNSHDSKSPAFILAVIGAGLWTVALIFAVILRGLAGSDSCTFVTMKDFRNAVEAITWLVSILLAIVVIVLGSVSSAKK